MYNQVQKKKETKSALVTEFLKEKYGSGLFVFSVGGLFGVAALILT